MTKQEGCLEPCTNHIELDFAWAYDAGSGLGKRLMVRSKL